jgi:hypothetical protein
VLAVLLASGWLAALPARAIDYVDGISDQHLASWAYSFAEGAQLSAPFPGSFAGPWAGGPLSRIRLARYVVQWDAMRGAGYPQELANLGAWYEATLALGLTPDLALANYNCADCDAPSDPADFASQLQALHGRFPAIGVYEAWNEPNLPGSFHLPAGEAAQLMNVTHAFCELRGCVAIAGDFSDAAAGLAGYEREYERALEPRDPIDWGIHLYRAVKSESARTLQEFRSLLPDPRGDRLWFTELGAYYCEFGARRGASTQQSNATYLVDRLIASADPLHAFYYQVVWPFDQRPPCGARTEDTALYAALADGGPLVARPAADVVLGWGVPWAPRGVD